MPKINIEIYGKKYTVNSDYDEKYIEKLAKYVNDKIKELVRKNPRLDFQDACALCLLNVADEFNNSENKLIQLKEEVKHLSEEINSLKSNSSKNNYNHTKNYYEKRIPKDEE